jgi:CDP-glucose 4,6-dehydratase
MDKRLEIYRGKKVLVTGDTGFKGGWLSLWLYKIGAHVIGYALDPPTKPSFYNAVELGKFIEHVSGDIRDREHLEKTVQRYKPDFIFHLAAQSLVRESYRDPIATFETNIIGTANILEAARKSQSMQACVIITSDKCYENLERQYAYRETDPLGGHDPYSSSKACAEIVTTAYRRSFFSESSAERHKPGLATARAGNVIGGGDWGNNRILPDCVRALSQGKEVIVRNPDHIRPWQYVLEPLYGYLLLGSMLSLDHGYEGAWNFGPLYQDYLTVKKLVELVIDEWRSGSYRIERDRYGMHEAAMLQLDATKAFEKLDWKSIYGIEETIRRTIAWYREFYAMTRPEQLYSLSIKELDDYQSALKLHVEDRSCLGISIAERRNMGCSNSETS